MLDRADRTAPTRQDELDHTDLPCKDLDSHEVGRDNLSDVCYTVHFEYAIK